MTGCHPFSETRMSSSLWMYVHSDYGLNIELSTCYLTTSHQVVSSWRVPKNLSGRALGPSPAVFGPAGLCWRCGHGRLTCPGLCGSHPSAQARRLYLPCWPPPPLFLPPGVESRMGGWTRSSAKFGWTDMFQVWTTCCEVPRMPSSGRPGWRTCKCETMACPDGPSVIPVTHISVVEEGTGRGTARCPRRRSL
jgi:hypothetical protein